MIKIENITKTFKSGPHSTEVLKDVSLTVPIGSWISIVGPSGSGKSTLLNIITGLVKPTRGKVWFGNMDINKLKDKEKADLRRKHIGFIFQDFKLLPYYSVLDNVLLPVYDTKNKREEYNRAQELLEMVGIGQSLFNRLPEGLSGGEKQRVAIARALIANPDVIVCDEPTGNLDQKNRDQIICLLAQLKEKQKTIIVVTHDMEVAHHGDETYYLSNGTIHHSEVSL
jgi:putative ABC transport system ATP-binding protein